MISGPEKNEQLYFFILRFFPKCRLKLRILGLIMEVITSNQGCLRQNQRSAESELFRKFQEIYSAESALTTILLIADNF